MNTPEALEILVDSDVVVPSRKMPRRIIDALRRHLRQHALNVSVQNEEVERLLTLIEVRDGHYRMPQGMLARLTATCRRYGIPCVIQDRRANVSSPALRSHHQLSSEERTAVKRLLLKDVGVVVQATGDSRVNLAVELIIRRQQRTLIAVDDKPSQSHWVDKLRTLFDSPKGLIQPLQEADERSWIVVGDYHDLSLLPRASLMQDYGQVICDGLIKVEILPLMRAVRAIGARYLVGLAEENRRNDGFHASVFYAFGGIVYQVASMPSPNSVKLLYQNHTTEFRYPYEGRTQYQALLKAMAGDEKRCAQIAHAVIEQAQAGHPTLLLSDRRDHLENIAALFPKSLKWAYLVSTIRPAERRRILERFDRHEVTVLLATSQIAVETVVTHRIQRLFLTFPITYLHKLEVMANRLLQPAENKIDAIIFDFDDIFVEPLHRAFAKRSRLLLKLCRKIDEPLQEEMQLELPLG